ncbi:integrin alpha-D-like, partial [Cricetulus griseus]
MDTEAAARCTWRPSLFSCFICWAQHSAASCGSNGDGAKAVFHQHAIFSRQEESTKHFNFSSSDGETRREAEHRYRVNNLSQWKLAVRVNFWAPILLNGVTVWEVAVQAS